MKIVMLVGNRHSSKFLVSKINSKFRVDKVLVENKQPYFRLILRRIQKLGVVHVLGQLLFYFYYICQKYFSKPRISQILYDSNLSDINYKEIDSLEYVDSANSEYVCLLLANIQPDLVIVNGTRILSQNVLKSCKAKFINIHAGITTKYRGAHGGYWALVNDDRLNCGVTIHFIDEGIDTGSELCRSVIYPTSSDNFSTYPYLQLAAGIPLVMKLIDDFKDGWVSESLISTMPNESKVFYIPTLWGYLMRRWLRGIR